MDIREGDVIDMEPVGGAADIRGLDGAVAELAQRDDGTMAAVIRIPGPKEG